MCIKRIFTSHLILNISRSFPTQEQIYHSYQLDRNNLPGWTWEEVSRTLLPNGECHKHQEVDLSPNNLRQIYLQQIHNYKNGLSSTYLSMWFDPVFVPSLPHPRSQSVCLFTLKGDFTLNAIHAADIVDLVVLFQAGLTERSQYAVALQEVNRQGQPFLRS